MSADKSNMKEVIFNFPEQIKAAAQVGKDAPIPEIKEISNIVICGMGGSAIGGDLLQQYLIDEIAIPVWVNRDYKLPEFVNQKSLVFISSYSGNTEETLSQYEKALQRTKNIICITSNGKLENENHPFTVKIPQGYKPRCAIAWMFVPLISILQRLKIISNKDVELNETIDLLTELRREYEIPGSSPFKLAKKLLNKLPIVYSDSRFSPVAKRWVTQFNENSKTLAHFHTFPELNHNEIVGFGEPAINAGAIILRDRDYHSQVQRRIELTKKLIAPYAEISEIESQGDSMLARFLSLLYFGDWTSYWLAILREVDPTPTERIEQLKKELTK